LPVFPDRKIDNFLPIINFVWLHWAISIYFNIGATKLLFRRPRK
jgi:hypothetical protein